MKFNKTGVFLGIVIGLIILTILAKSGFWSHVGLNGGK